MIRFDKVVTAIKSAKVYDLYYDKNDTVGDVVETVLRSRFKPNTNGSIYIEDDDDMPHIFRFKNNKLVSEIPQSLKEMYVVEGELKVWDETERHELFIWATSSKK